MGKKIERKFVASINHQPLKILESIGTLRSICILLVEQFNAVFEQLRRKSEEERVEDLVISNMGSVILLDYVLYPFWYFFLYVIETNSLNFLLFLAFLMNYLA